MTYITCAFINSDSPPILEQTVTGLSVQEHYEYGIAFLILSGFYDVYYPHPDGADIKLHVLEQREILRAHSGNKIYPAVYLLLQAQKALLGSIKE